MIGDTNSMKTGYCKNCRKITQWIKHCDFDYYLCATRGCFTQSKNPEKEELPKIEKSNHYFAYA